jgi:uncharacterized protein (TIGR02302 family)
MSQKAPGNSGRGGPEDPRGLPWIHLRLAQAAIFWERLWPALWPAVLITGLFLVVALLDILPALPAWLHAAFLFGFAGAFLYALWHGVAGFRRPDLGAAARRLERDGGVQHRPLAALFDRPAGLADAAGSTLWRAHRQRLVAELARLRLLPPRAGLARRDPWGLRAALVLVLVVAAAAAGTDWRGRLADAATPDLAGWGRGAPPVLDLWITPPDYTGAPPVVLSAGATTTDTAGAAPAESPASATPVSTAPVSVPEGSKVVAQLQGGRGAAMLVLGDRAAPFAASEPGAQRAEGAILTGDRLAVTQDDETIAEWPLAVTPDDAPTITFAEPPAATERAALRLAYDASDDYGVTAVVAVIQRTDRGVGLDGSDRIELPMPVPGAAPKAAQASSYHDLAPHPWAGLPVDIHLEARDALDQRAQSETVATVLPERVFNHPVARAIIAERKKLILDPEDRRSVARNLAAIGSIPEAFDNDVVVSLALRSALRRLVLNREASTVSDVVDLLWDTALRVEDGGLAVAERELRAAQEALQDALAGDASDAEIDRLMDELQRALEKFMAALAEQMKQHAENGEMQPMDPNAQMLRPQDLQDLVERAREMAKTGARDAARDLLAQLQEMLENLKAGQPMMGEGQQSEALEMLRDLDELSRRQQELLDKSFRQSQQGQGEPQQGQGQQGQPGQSEPGQQAPGQQGGQQGDAAMQEALRQGLGEVMRRFGEMTGDIPYPLGRAEREMKDAVDALRQGGPGEAIGPQTRALEELQQAGRAMAEQLMQQLGNQPGNGEGQQQQLGRNRDPLGRTESGNGAIDTGDVAIPEEADIQRSREILDELHRRAGERERPRIEQDYIDRLLRRF